MPSAALEDRIYRTLLYFSLFDMPLTAFELWRSLVAGEDPVTLQDVEASVASSDWLCRRVTTQHGYYCLKNKEESIARRIDRFLVAQHKWKLTCRLTRLLVWVPGVEMIAASGSLALYNTNPSSDLDIFIITQPGRIWTVRLLLLVVTQLTGRRRTYRNWQDSAPDLLCLNHYLTTQHLTIDPSIRSMYTAMLYTHLVPLFGYTVYKRFMAANESWLKTYVTFPQGLSQPLLQLTTWGVWATDAKQFLNTLLASPLGAWVEQLARLVQRRVIERHSVFPAAGRVVVSDNELAFHPGDKAQTIVAHFARLTN